MQTAKVLLLVVEIGCIIGGILMCFMCAKYNTFELEHAITMSALIICIALTAQEQAKIKWDE